MLNATQAGVSLLCSVGGRLYAIPVEHVVETMRPLPIEPIAGAPAIVSGLSIVRGEAVPVVDGARLLGSASTSPSSSSSPASRFVAMRVGARRVVLAVDGVVGIRHIPAAALHELPPLLRDAAAEVVDGIGALDAQLLVVLRTFHFVPESLSVALRGEGGAA